jgi:hypothetical protein
MPKRLTFDFALPRPDSGSIKKAAGPKARRFLRLADRRDYFGDSAPQPLTSVTE